MLPDLILWVERLRELVLPCWYYLYYQLKWLLLNRDSCCLTLIIPIRNVFDCFAFLFDWIGVCNSVVDLFVLWCFSGSAVKWIFCWCFWESHSCSDFLEGHTEEGIYSWIWSWGRHLLSRWSFCSVCEVSGTHSFGAVGIVDNVYWIKTYIW